MGKKSRRNRPEQASAPPQASVAASPPVVAATSQEPLYYPSDGPSDVELLQTRSTSLQAKLNQLTQLGLANDRSEFVHKFVPLDLSLADTEAYIQDLTTAPEAEGQWRNLVAEIAAIRSGQGVNRIEGDQVSRAAFFFQHPLQKMCDREVSFICVNGEWRAEG